MEALAGFFFEFWFLKNILHTNFVELHVEVYKIGQRVIVLWIKNSKNKIFLRFLIKNLFI